MVAACERKCARVCVCVRVRAKRMHREICMRAKYEMVVKCVRAEYIHLNILSIAICFAINIFKYFFFFVCATIKTIIIDPFDDSMFWCHSSKIYYDASVCKITGIRHGRVTNIFSLCNIFCKSFFFLLSFSSEFCAMIFQYHANGRKWWMLNAFIRNLLSFLNFCHFGRTELKSVTKIAKCVRVWDKMTTLSQRLFDCECVCDCVGFCILQRASVGEWVSNSPNGFFFSVKRSCNSRIRWIMQECVELVSSEFGNVSEHWTLINRAHIFFFFRFFFSHAEWNYCWIVRRAKRWQWKWLTRKSIQMRRHRWKKKFAYRNFCSIRIFCDTLAPADRMTLNTYSWNMRQVVNYSTESVGIRISR